jgi:hypothetical protein
VLVARTRITLSDGEPVLYKNELIEWRIDSDISDPFLFRKKASASSMNKIMPWLWFSAQSKSLFSSKTA